MTSTNFSLRDTISGGSTDQLLWKWTKSCYDQDEATRTGNNFTPQLITVNDEDHSLVFQMVSNQAPYRNVASLYLDPDLDRGVADHWLRGHSETATELNNTDSIGPILSSILPSEFDERSVQGDTFEGTIMIIKDNYSSNIALTIKPKPGAKWSGKGGATKGEDSTDSKPTGSDNLLAAQAAQK
jgi:hypothetical protein